VDDTFSSVRTEADLKDWNLYMPLWAPIDVVPDPADAGRRCLRLRDEDPYDYAKAERIFAEGSRVRVRFRVMQRQLAAARLEVEVQGPRGERPMRLRFDRDDLSFDEGKVSPFPVPMDVGRWHDVELRLDCAGAMYDAWLDGRQVQKKVPFAAPAST